MPHSGTHPRKDGKATGVVIRNQNGEVWTEPADHVVANDCAKSVAALGRKGSEGYQQVKKPSFGCLCVFRCRRKRYSTWVSAPPPVSL